MGGLLPRMLMLNAMNRRSSYAVCSGNLSESLSVAKMNPNLSNFSIRQLGLTIIRTALLLIVVMAHLTAKWTLVSAKIRAALSLLPTFSNHIIHIRLSVTNFKVFRINATWIVALMQDIGSFRNRAVKQMIRYAVPHPDSFSIFNKFNRCVTLGISGVLPLPAAAFRYSVSSVKAFNEVFFKHITHLGTGLNSSVPKVGG